MEQVRGPDSSGRARSVRESSPSEPLARGLTQKEVARLIEMDQDYLSRVENGMNMPNVDIPPDIARDGYVQLMMTIDSITRS